MFIIGCDFHSRFQQIATLDPTTGEVIKRRLEQENVSPGSGYRRRRSGICGKCCGIGTNWFVFVPR
jgi:hypothetical protein